MRDAGHDVSVWCWGPDVEWEPHGIDVRAIRYLPARGGVFSTGGAPDVLDREPWRVLEGAPAVAAALVHAMREEPPDLWVGHWFVPGGLVARLCGKLTRRPSLVVGHSAGIHLLANLPKPLRAPLERLIVQRGSTTVPTHALAAKLSRPVDVLPMGFVPVEPVDSPGENVLCYGRLAPIKGFDVALDALSVLERGGPPRVEVAGDGPERIALEKQWERLGVDATFHGPIAAHQKPQVFGRCQLALFPSRVTARGRHEGWPLSVLEASSAGVVPLVADWPGAAEMVADPELQVVRGIDPASWADAISCWLDLTTAAKSELRTTTIAHARRFTWKSLAPQWHQLVKGLPGVSR